MNHYGSQAMQHWRKWLPSRYATITDPNRFFEDLGLQVQAQIAELTPQLAGQDPPGESYLGKVGRLNRARSQAEEIVLRDLVLLPPEPEADPEATEEPPAADPSQEWIPLVEDPSHLYWAQARDQERQAKEPPTP